MKKRLIMLFVSIIILCSITGCSSESRTLLRNISYVNSKYMTLQTVEEADGYTVFRDINTNVLYMYAGRDDKGVLIPILNSDGTPKLYEEN